MSCTDRVLSGERPVPARASPSPGEDVRSPWGPSCAPSPLRREGRRASELLGARSLRDHVPKNFLQEPTTTLVGRRLATLHASRLPGVGGILPSYLQAEGLKVSKLGIRPLSAPYGAGSPQPRRAV